LYGIIRFSSLITIPLMNQQEAAAGSAEAQPARNISGYLSIDHHYLSCFI
jgi:hypothetical protein